MRAQRLLNKCKAKSIKLELGPQFNYQYLTNREWDVLKYIALGYTAKKIGQALNISFRTVECYIEALKIKLQCASKGEMLALIIKSGLIHHLDLLE